MKEGEDEPSRFPVAPLAIHLRARAQGACHQQAASSAFAVAPAVCTKGCEFLLQKTSDCD